MIMTKQIGINDYCHHYNCDYEMSPSKTTIISSMKRSIIILLYKIQSSFLTIISILAIFKLAQSQGLILDFFLLFG